MKKNRDILGEIYKYSWGEKMRKKILRELK